MKGKIIILCILSLGLLFWEQKKETKETLIFCNVGQGDGALMITKEANILIDTGPNNKMILDCLEKNLPLWKKTIDLLIISHWDSDHSGSLKELQKYYKLGKIVCPDYESGTNEQKNCSNKLKNGDIVNIGLIKFEILSPGRNNESKENDQEKDNENSLVMILDYKDKKILFTGDAPTEVEERLVWRKTLNEKIDILKVSHHGSAGATSETLLEKIKPAAAIVSVGKNKFGHPTKETIERLKKYQTKIWRTDENGSVKISF